jgi:WD40 repeat protein
VTVSVAALASPYKGLAPFDDSDLDALLFFGRERDSEVIAANLMATRVTVLYAPSGFGKTSVLRAGVAFRLRREEQAEVVVFSTWPEDPVAALVEAVGETGESLVDAVANAANRAAGDLYLILDQFEEYFLYHQHDNGFVDALAGVARRPGVRVNILIAIREEALAQLDAFKAAIPNLLSNRLRLQRLDRASGEAAIKGPARRYNDLVGGERAVELEPQLVASVLDEVAAGRVELGGTGRGVSVADVEDGGIEAPYLQLVMSRLWDVEAKHGSKTLRLQTLRELGGAAQIVKDHLDHAMDELSARQKDVAAAMYTFLVTPSGTKIAHDVRDLADYADVGEQEADQVLRRLSAERIVRSDSDNGTGSRYEIYHDVLAAAVVAWRNRHSAERALQDADRRRRRALLVAAAALAGLILIGAIAVYALVERGNSRSQARRARAEALAAQALTDLGIDPSSSLRHAYEAARLRPEAREESVLRTALSADRLRSILSADGPISVVAYDASGGHELVGSLDGNLRMYRSGSSRPTHVFDVGVPVTAAAITQDGRFVAGGGKDGRVRIWDAATGSRRRAMRLPGEVHSLAFVGRRREIVAATSDLISLWHMRDGRQVASIPLRTDKDLVKVVVSPDARQVVAQFRSRIARVYALPSGRLMHRLTHDGFIEDSAYSPDGRLIGTSGYAGDAGGVRLWNARSGRLIRGLRGALLHVLDIAFTEDGKLVGGASADGTARIWEVRTGTQIAIMIGHQNQVTSVDFNRSGTALVSASSDGTARVWGASGGRLGRLLSVLAGHRAPIVAAVFAPDGRSVLTGGQDSTARIWDPGSEPPLKLLARSPQSIVGLAVRGEGRRIFVRREDGTIEERTLEGRLARRSGRAPTTRSRAVAPGGDVGAIALPDGTAKLFDPRTNRTIRVLRGHADAVNSVDFSPDGRLLVTASDDHDGRIWEVETGRLLQKLHGHFGPVLDARFSPDGRWVVTAGPITAGLWLVRSTAAPILLDAPVNRPLSAVSFAGRDGRLIVATSLDGTLRSYHCDLCGNVDELLLLAKRRLAVER